MDSLPLDDLLRILSHLPLKTVIKFSLVSRKWNDLITSTLSELETLNTRNYATTFRPYHRFHRIHEPQCNAKATRQAKNNNNTCCRCSKYCPDAYSPTIFEQEFNFQCDQTKLPKTQNGPKEDKNPLDSLKNNRIFLKMQEDYRNNPDLIKTGHFIDPLNTIRKSDPQIWAILSENPSIFLQMLGHQISSKEEM